MFELKQRFIYTVTNNQCQIVDKTLIALWQTEDGTYVNANLYTFEGLVTGVQAFLLEDDVKKRIKHGSLVPIYIEPIKRKLKHDFQKR